MTAQELQQRWVHTINGRDADAYADLYAPNAIVHDPAYDAPLEGRDAIREDVAAFFRTFPDLRATPRTWLEADGAIAGEGSFEGTHEGPLLTATEQIPASGRRVKFDGAGFYRLDGQGRILEERRYYDLAGMLSQIGVLT
jgi:steroid delta-isomerase-like uncharacterized protein